MTEENNNNNLSDQFGDEEDDEVSMVDVLNEQARLQADADAVLGGSDANHCTYPQGCVKRQALYACVTCTPEGNAGICLACSYACHEGHELYELYTKRYFTCDCGNDKFGGKECKLYKETKKGLNADNRYSQNFKGVYCTCARPYPDPEDTVEDEMIQCIMCEDWYHGRHLQAAIPEDFHEMICPGCMSKFTFLWAYNIPTPVRPAGDACADTLEESIDVCSVADEEAASGWTGQSAEASDIKCTEPLSTNDQIVSADISGTPDHQHNSESPSSSRKRQADIINGDGLQDVPSPKKVKCETEQHKEETSDQQTTEVNDNKNCILKSLQNCVAVCSDSASFWPEGWRSKLCQCQDCLQMYKEKDIEFLIDESDTVRAYEEKGRDSAGSMSVEDSTASVLAGMNRVQQIEVVRGFMDMKNELNEFLTGFAQNGKVVTETDIREFFQRMDQRRKERMHVPQYTCR